MRLFPLFVSALCLGYALVSVTNEVVDSALANFHVVTSNVAGSLLNILSPQESASIVANSNVENNEAPRHLAPSGKSAGLRRTVYRVKNPNVDETNKAEGKEMMSSPMLQEDFDNLDGMPPMPEGLDSANMEVEDKAFWSRALQFSTPDGAPLRGQGPKKSATKNFFYKYFSAANRYGSGYHYNRYNPWKSRYSSYSKYGSSRSSRRYSNPTRSGYYGTWRGGNGKRGRNLGRWGGEGSDFYPQGSNEGRKSPKGNFSRAAKLGKPPSDQGQRVPEIEKVKTKISFPQLALGRSLDLFVAGFPKCGTTTLLFALEKHPETEVGEKEQCDISGAKLSDQNAYARLNQALSELGSEDPSVKTAIKCPIGIKNFHGIERLQHHSPDARFVIGVRHPVKFFQSFYNYRVTEIYNKGIVESEMIPSAVELIGSTEWKGVSTDNAQFELFLMQLGKADVTVADLAELSQKPNMAVTPSKFKVFLYSVEQMEDDDEERSQRFRNDMQGFMQLKDPLDSFELRNKNFFVGEEAFPETIDICDAKYDSVRALLVSQGKKTSEWIRTQFLRSPDVFVGERDHFEQLLLSWGSDPCDEERKREPEVLTQQNASNH